MKGSLVRKPGKCYNNMNKFVKEVPPDEQNKGSDPGKQSPL